MTQIKLYSFIMLFAILLPFYLNFLYFGEIKTGEGLAFTSFLIFFSAISGIFIHYMSTKENK